MYKWTSNCTVIHVVMYRGTTNCTVIVMDRGMTNCTLIAMLYRKRPIVLLKQLFRDCQIVFSKHSIWERQNVPLKHSISGNVWLLSDCIYKQMSGGTSNCPFKTNFIGKSPIVLLKQNTGDCQNIGKCKIVLL